MVKNQYEFPKSSFLGMDKDTAIIMKRILNNKNLLKLIYYTDRDWRSKPDLTEEETASLLVNQQIWHVPKVYIDEHFQTYLRVNHDLFVPNMENPYYRDSVVEFKILCHYKNWALNNYELRPYRIAGELDSMFNGARLTGIGTLDFIDANQVVQDEEFGGVVLRYLATRGHEDEINPVTGQALS